MRSDRCQRPIISVTVGQAHRATTMEIKLLTKAVSLECASSMLNNKTTTPWRDVKSRNTAYSQNYSDRKVASLAKRASKLKAAYMMKTKRVNLVYRANMKASADGEIMMTASVYSSKERSENHTSREPDERVARLFRSTVGLTA